MEKSTTSRANSPSIAIIGAGPSGIAAAKNVIEAGLGDGLVVFEKGRTIGGNWVYPSEHSSVYETTHTISSRYLSEYEDFPLPQNVAEYPHHTVLCQYFESYARSFGVAEKVQFQCEVVRAVRDDRKRWVLEVCRYKKDNKTIATTKETFDVLMVANGHHWDPRWPELPGTPFAGTLLHAHSFKHNRPDCFQNKRVLVIGGGNSACDIAAECSRVSKKTCISMRRGHWIVPKFMAGIPCDVINASLVWIPIPIFLREWFFKFLVWIFCGRYERLGLQTPEYGILQGHITMNSELFYLLGHGSIEPRPGIDRVAGHTVSFKDGRQEEFDTLVCATGYHITFPFFDQSFIDWKDVTHVPLWRRMFHPDASNLYFIGLFQPLGCIWPLADYQALLACQEILGNYRRPKNLKTAIEQERRNPHYRFVEAPRHSTEVDYHRYRKELLEELRKCNVKPRRRKAFSPLVSNRVNGSVLELAR